MNIRALLILLMSILVGCAPAMSKDEYLSWDDLGKEKSKFDGLEITLCGWFVADRDMCVLHDKEEGAEQTIWVRPRSDICLPVRVFEEPVHSWATVSGRYHHGAKYGLFGLYESALTDAEVSIGDCRELLGE